MTLVRPFDGTPLVGSGKQAYDRVRDLFPISRSLTGPGVRQTLAYVQNLLPDIQFHAVKTGSKAFDWIVPQEWLIEEAYVVTPDGRRIMDFAENNLHLVGYSVAVAAEISLEDLQARLHSLPENPDAIPYVTSYYKPYWGFCLTQRERDALLPGSYRVVIKSRHIDGVLNYGEMLIPGREDKEILISTNICHPSMANNELSGPVVAMALAEWLRSLGDLRYSYRIVFVPETIGAIVFLADNLEHLKEKVVAGFVVTCAGDDGPYGLIPSRDGDTLADRAALHALRHHGPMENLIRYTFLDRGSDERQYCSPGVDLPVCSVTRSKYATFPEYHTSLDDLSVISPAGLQSTIEGYAKILWLIENNHVWLANQPCEPQLGRYGLYPTLSGIGGGRPGRRLADFLAYADGSADYLQICEIIGADGLALLDQIAALYREDLIRKAEEAE